MSQWLNDIKERQSQQIKLDINVNWSGLQSADILQKVYEAVNNNENFALACESSTVYFVADYMIHKGGENTITKFESKRDFENALKLVLLGHKEFLPAKKLISDNWLYNKLLTL